MNSPDAAPNFAVQIVALIDLLRRPPGASVTIFNAGVMAIEVCDGWTGWERRRFHGETLLAALQAAYTASRAA